jgi:hypothetical protein
MGPLRGGQELSAGIRPVERDRQFATLIVRGNAAGARCHALRFAARLPVQESQPNPDAHCRTAFSGSSVLAARRAARLEGA